MDEKTEKKSLKIRLSTVFLILAIIIIGILCCALYIQKQDYTKQIAYLEDQVTIMSTNSVSMQSTIDNLEGKLGAIANVLAGDEAKPENTVEKTEVKNETATNTVTTSTEPAAKPDFIYTTEELSEVNSKDNTTLNTFFDKHVNKTIQITGAIVNLVEDDMNEGYYVLNIGKTNSADSKIYGGARLTKEAYEKVKDTPEGSVVAISGTLKEKSWPITLEDAKVITIEQ